VELNIKFAFHEMGVQKWTPFFVSKLSWSPGFPGPGSPVDQKNILHGIQ